MSIFLVSHTVSILRGTATETAYGSSVDSLTVVTAGLPASIVERQVFGFDSERRAYVDNTLSVLLDAGTDVREGDRLLDQDGLTCLVKSASPSAGPMSAFPVQVVARRVEV